MTDFMGKWFNITGCTTTFGSTHSAASNGFPGGETNEFSFWTSLETEDKHSSSLILLSEV